MSARPSKFPCSNNVTLERAPLLHRDAYTDYIFYTLTLLDICFTTAAIAKAPESSQPIICFTVKGVNDFTNRASWALLQGCPADLCFSKAAGCLWPSSVFLVFFSGVETHVCTAVDSRLAFPPPPPHFAACSALLSIAQTLLCRYFDKQTQTRQNI